MADLKEDPTMARRDQRLARGELEGLVMDALWSRDEWLAPAEVVSMLERSHPIAYTTAMTILVRLWNKGMVDRRQSGRAFAYHPVMTRDEWTALRMHEVLEAATNRPAALSHFVATLDTKQLAQLRKAVRPRRGS
jgi:predicted transcriptional regulator